MKKYKTPYNVHIKGLKSDLKIYQEQIIEFKKGIKKNGFNSSNITLETFIEATMQARYIIFLLEEELTGNIYKNGSEGYSWETKK